MKFAICTVSLAQLRRLPTANWAEFNMATQFLRGASMKAAEPWRVILVPLRSPLTVHQRVTYEAYHFRYG